MTTQWDRKQLKLEQARATPIFEQLIKDIKKVFRYRCFTITPKRNVTSYEWYRKKTGDVFVLTYDKRDPWWYNWQRGVKLANGENGIEDAGNDHINERYALNSPPHLGI